jgi:hypothetical protein
MFDFLSGGGGGKNPADAAMPYLNQIPGTIAPYFNPFITQGNASAPIMRGLFDAMSTDPASVLENIMGSYQPSKSYQLKKDEMTKAAGNTAAAGGMRGSLQDITNESRITDALLGDDMQQWLNNVLGIQGKGLEGISHLYDTGYDASKSLAGDLSNVLGTQAGLAFQGQANKNQKQSDMWGGLGKLAGAGIGAYFGGPWGAAAGANIGGSFF